MITRTAEHLVYENDYIKVFDDAVIFDSGRSGTYLRIEPAIPGQAAVLVARDSSRRIALVETYRYALGVMQWALPRGFSHGANLEETVKNEAREELGAEISGMRLLGCVTPDSGTQSSRVAVVSFDAIDVRVPTDTDEVSSVKWVTLEELMSLVKDRELEDGFTLAALALLLSDLTDDA